MVCPTIGRGRAPRHNRLRTAREDQDARSLEARIIRLEADVSALTQDRRWLMQLLAGLAVELEELR